MLKIHLPLKFIAILIIAYTLYGCGQPDPTNWYSYRDRNRLPVAIKVESAEILSGNEKEDTIRISMIWKNPGNEMLTIDDEKFSLDVSGVKLNPQNFDTLRLDPEQEIQRQYDFLLLKSFVDKTKFKLSFENWAEIPVLPVRK